MGISSVEIHPTKCNREQQSERLEIVSDMGQIGRISARNLVSCRKNHSIIYQSKKILSAIFNETNTNTILHLQFGNGTLDEIPVKITRTTIVDSPEKKVMQPAQQNVMKSKLESKIFIYFTFSN